MKNVTSGHGDTAGDKKIAKLFLQCTFITFVLNPVCFYLYYYNFYTRYKK